jgi:hypothetical protein
MSRATICNNEEELLSVCKSYLCFRILEDRSIIEVIITL